MKKFNNKANVVGNLIKEYRIKNGFNKSQLGRKLELLGIELSASEINKVENNSRILKDFELIGFITVLNIELKELKESIDF